MSNIPVTYLAQLMQVWEEISASGTHSSLSGLIGLSILCYYCMPVIITVFLICFLLKSFK